MEVVVCVNVWVNLNPNMKYFNPQAYYDVSDDPQKDSAQEQLPNRGLKTPPHYVMLKPHPSI